ncbi:MAG: hypothetical protein PHV20_04060 [Bacteroidales bacterium]|nr:hypothetical protein [Bacteroidales bacterium]
MKRYFSIIALAFLALSSHIKAQNFEKLNAQETKSDIIYKYRNLLIDKIVANDTAQAKTLLQEFNSSIDETYYVTLYPAEKWLLSILLKDYKSISRDVQMMDSTTLVKLNRRVQPKDDQLHQIIYQKIIDQKKEVTEEIENCSSISDEDRSLFLLILDVYASTSPRSKYYDEINSQSTKFINNYPKSSYNDYIKRNIRFEYKPAGFSMGMEIYSGASILTGRTNESLSSGGTFGLGFIWGYNSFQLNTRAAFVFSGLKKDIDYKGYTWQNSERAQLMLPEVSLGYKFMPSKKISVSPIVGVGWLMISPYQNDQDKNVDLKNIEIISKASPVLGIDFGWEFANMFYYNDLYQKPMSNFSSLNIRYTVQPIAFSAPYVGMNGLTHNISISFKFGIGSAKRIL